jgi:hypothetical protein
VADVPACPTNLAQFLALGGTASDLCSSNLTYACSDSPLVGGVCGGTIQRTHTVTDDCTKAMSCVQIIAVHDTIAPVLVGVPSPDANYPCLSEVPPPATVTATDNCGPVPVTLVCTTNGSCPLTIVCTWRAVDACINSTTSTATITVRDPMPPVLFGVPADQTYQCLGDVPPPPVVTAQDNCSGALTVRFTESRSAPGSSCPNVLTRIWSATDTCSNSVTASQTLTVLDTLAPTLTCAPPKTVPAGQVWAFDAPVASDLCDESNLTIRVVSTVTNQSGPCSIVVTRTWEAEDG